MFKKIFSLLLVASLVSSPVAYSFDFKTASTNVWNVVSDKKFVIGASALIAASASVYAYKKGYFTTTAKSGSSSTKKS